MDLGSEVITEVEIQPQMEEVEIESETLDDDEENGGIEISVEESMSGLVSDDEVMLQAQEEIVDYDDPTMALVDNAEILIEPPGPSSSSFHHHPHKKMPPRKLYHNPHNSHNRYIF
jgi:hypothetical protein